jgi:hypothetical protein
MNLVCNGAFIVGSKVSEDVDLARGSSKAESVEEITLPEGGDEGWEGEDLRP